MPRWNPQVSELHERETTRRGTHLSVETEHAENCRSRYFNIDSICKQHLQFQYNLVSVKWMKTHIDDPSTASI